MAKFFPYINSVDRRAMVFIDGENLAIRYGNMLKQKSQNPPAHLLYEPNILVWSPAINNTCVDGGVIRKYYYTSVQGDEQFITAIEEKLKSAGIETPRVFKKTKGRGSKRVDITLATDMLTHASRRNYETAVLIAGDEDYVPLVEAVKAEGCRVLLWFLEDGLSPALKRCADWYANIGEILFAPEITKHWR